MQLLTPFHAIAPMDQGNNPALFARPFSVDSSNHVITDTSRAFANGIPIAFSVISQRDGAIKN